MKQILVLLFMIIGYVEIMILYMILVLEKMDISLSDCSIGHSLSKEAYEILKDKVEQLHNKNIIHKDLYSRNVLLKYKDKCVNEVIPYISDFGRSKSLIH